MPAKRGVQNRSKKVEKKSVNPFEVRVNRKKHDVLGQKSKSDVGLPGVSRSKSIQKRRKTLLVEYKQKNKSNKLVDRRFGEGEKEMTVEEKVMRRFILERKKKHERSSTFNLNDDEDLTHFGRSIGTMNKFDDVISDEDDMEEEKIEETHFGGFLKKKKKYSLETGEEEEAPPKTRKQIIDEIVTKSKVMKFERQSEKMEIQNLMETVDSEWKSVQNLFSKTEDSKHSRSVDDYDRSVRELQFERRGQALDRMKTEEELALEEKERLEVLEANRIHRMKGLAPEATGDDDDNKIMSADFMKDSISSTKKKDVQFTLRYKDGKMVLPSEGNGVIDGGGSSDDGDSDGDMCDDSEDDDDDDGGDDGSSDDGGGGGGDGDDDGDDDDGGGGGGGGGGDDDDDDDDGDGGGDGDGGDDGGSSDGECSGGSGYGSDLDSDDLEEEGEVPPAKEMEKMKVYHRESSQELPYTFTVPRSLEEFCSIVEHRSPEECVTAVERIHSCNHPSFSPTNKLRLQEFLCVLLEYCMNLGENPTCDHLATVDRLVRPLLKLARLDAQNSSIVFCNALSKEYKKWSLRMKEFPPLPTLILFQLVGKVFPPSDYQHSVTTPSFLFMGQILSNSRVKSIADLVHGLLICDTFIEYICDSKRFVPELVNFLTSAVGCFSKSNKCVFLPPCNPKSKLRRELTASMGDEEYEVLNSTLLELVTRCDLEVDHLTKCHALKVILDTSSRLLQLYKDNPSFPEIFEMFHSNLKRVAMMEWPLLIAELIQVIKKDYAEVASQPREILQLLKQKPKSIKFYEPKFDTVYEFSRKKSRGKAAGIKEKLKYKLKKETKGAIREIRKDSAFLAKVKLDETLTLDAERRKKTRQLMHELQTQKHEEKVERLHTKKR